jgi:hypothetical protein
MTGQTPRGRKRAFGEDEDELMESAPLKKPFEQPPPQLMTAPPVMAPYVAAGIPPPLTAAWPSAPIAPSQMVIYYYGIFHYLQISFLGELI